jgi:hypothetical protein
VAWIAVTTAAATSALGVSLAPVITPGTAEAFAAGALASALCLLVVTGPRWLQRSGRQRGGPRAQRAEPQRQPKGRHTGGRHAAP